ARALNSLLPHRKGEGACVATNFYTPKSAAFQPAARHCSPARVPRPLPVLQRAGVSIRHSFRCEPWRDVGISIRANSRFLLPALSFRAQRGICFLPAAEVITGISSRPQRKSNREPKTEN